MSEKIIGTDIYGRAKNLNTSYQLNSNSPTGTDMFGKVKDINARYQLSTNSSAGTDAQKMFASKYKMNIDDVMGMDQNIVNDSFSSNSGMTGMEMGQVGLGAAQLGLGFLGYNEDKKIAKAQVGLLREQLSNAKKENKRRGDVRSGLAAAFG
ncbi:MAG: hypothetical protein L3I99_01920 [Sulfurimonas sp.]|nr:hypothetical protein [Sulfurimonas sp.]